MFSRLALKGLPAFQNTGPQVGALAGVLLRGFSRHGVPARMGKALRPPPRPRPPQAALESNLVQGRM